MADGRARSRRRTRRGGRRGGRGCRVDRVLICTPDKDLGAVCRRQGRSVGSAARPVLRCRRRSRQVRCRSRVDSRLSRARWRQRRRLPRARRLRSPVSGGGPRQVRAPRGGAGRGRGLGRRHPQPGTARGHAAGELRARASVPRVATLETDADVLANVDDLRWTGPEPELVELTEQIGGLGLAGTSDPSRAERRGGN